MKAEAALRRLRRIRREARAILAAAPAPFLAQTMHTVDRACHLAAWQLGEAASLAPEGEGGSRARVARHPAGKIRATRSRLGGR